jgi:hypothetical protein
MQSRRGGFGVGIVAALSPSARSEEANMETGRFMLDKRRRWETTIGVSWIAVWVGCAAAPSAPTGEAGPERSRRAAAPIAGLDDHRPSAALATGPEQPTADFALAVDDADASAAMRAAPALLQAQSELYWTAAGGELGGFGSDDDSVAAHGDTLLVAAAVRRPDPGARERIRSCNVRDDRPGPKALWAACGSDDEFKKVVRHFFRAASRFPAPHFGCGRATLVCGNADGGFRHIKNRHRKDWEFIAAFDNEPWGRAADWGMWNALKHPSKTTYRADNDTWAYETPIHLKDRRTGKIVKWATVRTVVSRKTKNIVTALPTKVKNF